MGEIIAVTNQKGGVGKTTTVINMAAGLCRLEKKVLIVDMDPQCNLSYCAGVVQNVEIPSVFDLMQKACDPKACVLHFNDIDVITGDPMVSSLEQLQVEGREVLLQNTLSELKPLYDYIIIDGPPTLGLATINMLIASDRVIITVTPDMFSLQGLGQLYNTIKTIQQYRQPNLKIDGILITRFIKNRNSKKLVEMLEDTAQTIGVHLFSTPISESDDIRMATGLQCSVIDYAKYSKSAREYKKFVKEFLSNSNIACK